MKPATKIEDVKTVFDKMVFKPEEATPEDIFAFDSAQEWANAMNALAQKTRKKVQTEAFKKLRVTRTIIGRK